jgi:hypothetical protein
VSKLALAAPFLMKKLLVRSVRIPVVNPCYRWLCARARNSQIVAMVAKLSADHLRAAYYDRGCADGSDGDRCHPRHGGAGTARLRPCPQSAVEWSMSPAILLTWSCPMLQVRLLAGASERVSV